MLRAPGGDKAVVLRFRRTQLPCFTLWKNTRGLRDGYVTGLEPATNFPNPRPFEEARGRVVPLPPGGTFLAETTLEVLDDAEAVAAARPRSRPSRPRARRRSTAGPVEPFASPG